jgi:NADP-dependent 3-hydroxy acid dehydrogenase YdfG
MVGGRLKGRIALIAGASSGIGEATARILAGEGASVVLAARRRERLDHVVAAIEADSGTASAVTADVTNAAEVQAMVDFALQRHARIDILVNVAGIGVAAPFSNTRPEESRAMVEVNLNGFLHCLEATVPLFRAQRSGHIVVLSSGAGRYFHPSVVYSGTKHAVSAITESLRREVGKDGVRVTCIDPGAVKSEFLSHMRADIRQSVEDRLGEMEQLESEDIAEAVLYAVSQPRRVNVNILTIYPTEQA